jgi:RNA polymerase sigma factor (sigma-70 family)
MHGPYTHLIARTLLDERLRDADQRRRIAPHAAAEPRHARVQPPSAPRSRGAAMRYHDRHFAALQLERHRPGALSSVVRSAADGDALAWSELFRRFTRRIGAVARAHRLGAHETEDVVQDTWLRALEHLGDLRDPASVAGWLSTTARRESLRHIGQTSREVLAADQLEREAEESTAFETLARAERTDALNRAIERVNDRERALLTVLLADPEPSYAEVSAALGIPVGSIGPTRGRAIARLRRDPDLAAAVLD